MKGILLEVAQALTLLRNHIIIKQLGLLLTADDDDIEEEEEEEDDDDDDDDEEEEEAEEEEEEEEEDREAMDCLKRNSRSPAGMRCKKC